MNISRVFMKVVAGILLAAGVLFATPSDTSHHPLAGSWQGTLEAGKAKLRIVINLSGAPAQILKATIDSPDQGAMGIPVDSVAATGDSVHVILRSLGARYDGVVNDSLTIMNGAWRQSGMSFPLALRRVEKAMTLNRPQEPKPPFPYRSEDVFVWNEKGGDSLAGTLTIPEGDGPFPAVFLVTGSGPQDRNETVFGQKPFLVLSDYLTRHGIEVLRCDDRGIGKSTGDFGSATTMDFADDASACVEFLKMRKKVNPKAIGLIGHSEGGVIAPIVAVNNRDVSFIVLMAGTGVTGEQVLYEQSALISKASGASDSAVAMQRTMQERLFAVLKEEKDTAAIHDKLQKILEEQLKETPAEQREAASRGIAMEVRRMSSPWFRYFLMYDPAPTLAKVKCPVLALNGEKDLQVSPSQNLPVIRKALAGNPKASVRELPGLNHLFQHAKTGLMNEYVESEETISPEVLAMIGDWIHEVTR